MQILGVRYQALIDMNVNKDIEWDSKNKILLILCMNALELRKEKLLWMLYLSEKISANIKSQITKAY